MWCPRENKEVKAVSDYKCVLLNDGCKNPETQTIIRYSEVLARNLGYWEYHKRVLPSFFCPDCGAECHMNPNLILPELF